MVGWDQEGKRLENQRQGGLGKRHVNGSEIQRNTVLLSVFYLIYIFRILKNK
jgi:hypothetical protein